MDLILTHDNADFDAVASQLAAHKLIPDACPVIAARLNRNVRHFLSLYWDELPFINSKELPREQVERVYVVDTQTVQTIRGMNDETSVQIIDHHAPRPNLDPSWQLTCEQVGATTTILVERMRVEQTPLTPIEATLLLLGIYEDTGSLLYGSTTPRDGYAAAWLLEKGALLDVTRDFLDHDLGEDQMQLLERLQENAETLSIEGHAVVIAAAEAPGIVDEIATLAHRLREVLDPAAVFLLVELGRHIQMVARSTTDALDVGRIAEHFGGGGHERASAAIIRDIPLSEAKEILLHLLPRYVRPAITVAGLMSHGVQMLSPDTRIRDAASRMQKYGHEGFPVVEDGRVIGLLTRRAVDRAMGHGLDGVKTSQFMDAGEVTVTPDESISRLQQVMMTSGWGQIPVVDGQGRVIGVVTRTDLIKHMGHQAPEHTRREAVIANLEKHLPVVLYKLIKEAGASAQVQDSNLYIVGGGVRDLLLGFPTTDIDFVVEGNAIALTRKLCRQYGGETRSHSRFGTGKWLLDFETWQNIGRKLNIPVSTDERDALPQHIDFASARTEFYDAPTVLPDVEGSNIKLDLHRRDFTINTLAIRLDPYNFGQLLDFYGGEADLRSRQIRVLHSLSFIDDPTRILRAARFEQRLGFDIERRTAELITHAIPLIDRVTGDRIKHEFELQFDEEKPEYALCRLNQLGALEIIHPDLQFTQWETIAFRALRYAVSKPLWPELADEEFDTELPYFALFTYNIPLESVREVCRRLNVRRGTVTMLERVHVLRRHFFAAERDLKPSALDRLLRSAGDDVLVTLWAGATTAASRDQIMKYVTELRHISTWTTGETLKNMGLKPGPSYRKILEILRADRLDGIINTPDEEAAALQALLNKHL